MYESHDLAQKIKECAKLKGVTIKQMTVDLKLGINTISHVKSGQAITYKRLAKIADYLDCSVDYLLGRTDNPQSHKK